MTYQELDVLVQRVPENGTASKRSVVVATARKQRDDDDDDDDEGKKTMFFPAVSSRWVLSAPSWHYRCMIRAQESSH